MALRFLIIFLFILFASPYETSADVKWKNFCSQGFAESGKCPVNLCEPGCVYLDPAPTKCLLGCVPKSCAEIEPESCPEEHCQLIKGCTGEDVCYYKSESQPPDCGGIGYNGQDAQCCEGLIRRCGIEFFGGECDMEGEYSQYVAPICIPCGNGICDQFENGCNCPEDCQFRDSENNDESDEEDDDE